MKGIISIYHVKVLNLFHTVYGYIGSIGMKILHVIFCINLDTVAIFFLRI